MSDSVRPHRRQAHQAPPSLGFSSKNTGVGCHFLLQCMKVKSESEIAQSCLTLRDPMDCNLPGSSVHGIFQARVLEWGAIAFSNMSKRRVLIDKNFKMKQNDILFKEPFLITSLLTYSFLTLVKVIIETNIKSYIIPILFFNLIFYFYMI